MSTAARKLADWLRKDDAAAFLKVGVRQIERRAHQGYVRTRRQTQAGQPIVEYSREDLEAIRAGKPNSYGRVMPPAPVFHGETVHPAPASNDAALAVRQLDPFAALAAHLAKLAAAFPTPKPELPPWMTLDQAVEYSGLPRSFLLDSARAGAKFARNCGSEKRAMWRFNRDELAK